MQTPLSPSFARSVAWTLATRFALLPLGLLQGVLTARALGPQGLGLYSAVLVDVNLITTLLALGLPGGLAVLVGEAQGDKQTLHKLWKWSLRHVLGALFFGSLILVGTYQFLPSVFAKFVAERSSWVLVSLAMCVLGQLGRDIHNALLWGSQKFFAQNRTGLFVSVLQLCVIGILFRCKTLTTETALLLQGTSVWLLCIAFLWQLSVVSKGSLQPGNRSLRMGTEGAEFPTEKRLYQISFRNFLHILPDMLLFRIDVYLIEHFLAPSLMRHDLGLYQAGVRVAELILLLPGTLNAILFAKAAAKEAITEKALLSAKVGLYLGLMSCAGMFLFGKPLLTLFYGDRFAGAYTPCLLVLLGCSALCFSGPLAGALSGASGYPKSVIYAQCAALLCNVGVNLWLLPKLGMIGAAWASLAAYVVSAVWISVAFARRFHVPLALFFRPVPLRHLWGQIRGQKVQEKAQENV